MRRMGRGWRLAIGAGAIGISVVVGPLTSSPGAQTPQARGRQAPGAGPLAEGGGVTPREVQRLFDAYVVMQAQQELALTDDQYPKFLARLRTLQDVRRRGQSERGQIIVRLRQLSQSASPEDDQMRAQLKALADAEVATNLEQSEVPEV